MCPPSALPWCSCSPDLNPIEHLWDELGVEFRPGTTRLWMQKLLEKPWKKNGTISLKSAFLPLSTACIADVQNAIKRLVDTHTIDVLGKWHNLCFDIFTCCTAMLPKYSFCDMWYSKQFHLSSGVTPLGSGWANPRAPDLGGHPSEVEDLFFLNFILYNYFVDP